MKNYEKSMKKPRKSLKKTLKISEKTLKIDEKNRKNYGLDKKGINHHHCSKFWIFVGITTLHLKELNLILKLLFLLDLGKFWREV